MPWDGTGSPWLLWSMRFWRETAVLKLLEHRARLQEVETRTFISMASSLGRAGLGWDRTGWDRTGWDRKGADGHLIASFNCVYPFGVMFCISGRDISSAERGEASCWVEYRAKYNIL